MLKAIKHSKLDAGVVKQATECNKHMEGECSKAIGCKINNMKELEQALKNKKIDAEETKERAEKSLKKVKGTMAELTSKMNEAKAKEKREELEFKKEVDAALAVRMRELEQCERARLSADMKLKRECQKAEA